MERADVTVIGAGIVGLATACILAERYPARKILVLEKEKEIALHQTGRKSGVLHSGVYYKPASLKARNCVAGKQLMEQFCREEGLPYERCGKVIVALDADEQERLRQLEQRARQNGVECRMIGRAELNELEPHAAGLEALLVPGTGITDYVQICRRLEARLEARGGRVLCEAAFLGRAAAAGDVVLQTARGEVSSGAVVNCAGLHSDRVARLLGSSPAMRIVPFRGEYFRLRDEAAGLCRNLIYPVPDPRLPFLGVHFTRMIGGGVECGPNAVLAFAREGYAKTDFSLRDTLETLAYPGFRRVALEYLRIGAAETMRSLSKTLFVRALQRLIPDVRRADLSPAPAGVRAQAVDTKGKLVDDFIVQAEGRCVHVLNAPSPAATSALNIGRLIADRLAKQCGW